MYPDLAAFLVAASWTAWAAFAVDFMVRMVLADEHWRDARHHWRPSTNSRALRFGIHRLPHPVKGGFLDHAATGVHARKLH
jgi:hypothetical protein